MRTPDEIKNLLKNYNNFTYNLKGLFADTLDYIQQLERERDAAIRDIQHVCTRCIHSEHRFLADGKLDDRCGTCVYNGMCNWQWRGVREVE